MNPTTAAPTRDITSLSIEDKNALRSFMDRWAETEMANDLEAMANRWTDDAIFMPPNHEVLEGRPAILDWLKSMKFDVKDVTIDLHEVVGYGDLAYLRGSYSETFTSREFVEPTAERGKFLGVVRKQPDGTWLASHWTWNADLPISPLR